MPRQWSQSDGKATHEVEFVSDQEIEFRSSGDRPGRGDSGGESEAIWVEEFPDSDRWQRWVREHMGEQTLTELQNRVASELEELSASRKTVFAGAVEDLYADDPEVRRRGVDRVRSLAVRYGDLSDHAAEELGDRLEVDDEETRRRAADALRQVAEEHPGAVDSVRSELKRALGDDHPNVRLDAARALVVLAEPDDESIDRELLDTVVETLVGLLHEHTRWFSRGPVAGLLGEIGRRHPEVIEPAVEPLARFVVGELSSGSGTSGIGRSTAVQALAEIGAARVELVVDFADVFFDKLDSRRPGVRGRCAEVLGLLGAHGANFAGRAAGVLVGCLDDNDFVRESALQALRRIRDTHPEPVEEALAPKQLEELDGETTWQAPGGDA